MKNQTYLLLILSFISIHLLAQPTLQWESRFNGTLATDKGNCIVLDNDGNVFVGGSTDVQGEGSNFCLLKYNSAGTILWTKTFDGSAHGLDEITAIDLDKFNNVYVTGKIKSTSQGFNIKIIKYSPNGTLLHSNEFNGGANADDIAFDMEIDTSSGAVYIVGSSFYAELNTITSGVIIKYDSTLFESWSQGYHIGISQNGNYVATHIKINHIGHPVMTVYDDIFQEYQVFELDPVNGFYYINYYGEDIPGYPRGLALDDNGDIFVISSYLNGAANFYLIRYTHFGEQFTDWERYYNGPGDGNDVAKDIQVDANQNVYITGYADFYSNSPVNNNFVTIKYDVNGNVLWTKSFDDPNSKDNKPIGLLINNNSNPDVYVIGNVETNVPGIYDIIILKYSSNGNQIWQKYYDCGNNGQDIANAATKDNYDNLYITGYSDCDGTNQDLKTLKYCSQVPSQPGAIQGDFEVCSGTLQTLSVSLVQGATSYSWYLPSGWGIPTNGSTIFVTAGESGLISVVANNASCSSIAQSQAVIVHPAPAIIGSISGNPIVCEQSVQSYSIEPVNGATSYTWTLPQGWSQPASTNSISVNAGNSGVIMVTANTEFCASDPVTLSVTSSLLPGSLLPITGQSEVCSEQQYQYQVPLCSNATNYTWEIPLDWEIVQNQNVATLSPKAPGGVIKVTASNNCGLSNTQMLTLIVNQSPGSPSSIIGDETPCKGSPQNYAVNQVLDNNYTWSYSGQWLAPDTTHNTVNCIVQSSGTLQVFAINGGCNSAPISIDLVVQEKPSNLEHIDGDNTLCFPNAAIYSVVPSNGSYSYSWEFPTSWMGNSSLENISLMPDTSGVLLVYAFNDCGISNTVNLHVNVYNSAPSQPVLLSGDLSPCPHSNQVYSVNPQNDVEVFSWEVPAGWTGSSETNILNTFTGNSGSPINVYAYNACGFSQVLSILINFVNIDRTIVNNGPVLFAEQSNGSYQWKNCTTGEFIPGATGQEFTPTQDGAYKVIITFEGCIDSSDCVTIVDTKEIQGLPSSITIFPNPTNGQFTINGSELSETSLRIVDAFGRPIDFQYTDTSLGKDIQMTNTPDGIYFTILKIQGQEYFAKVLKSHF